MIREERSGSTCGTRLSIKGLISRVRPVRFADVETIRALTGQHLTPVLSDGDHVLHETWDMLAIWNSSFLATLRCSAVQLDAVRHGTSTSGRTRNL